MQPKKLGLATLGMLSISIIFGCSNSDKEELSEIYGEKYTIHELADLGSSEESDSINTNLMYYLLDKKVTDKDLKEAETLTEYTKNTDKENKYSEEDLEASKKMYARNQALQRYYSKTVKISDKEVNTAYKEGYYKSEFIQAVSLGEFSKDLKELLKAEVDKVTDVDSSVAFVDFYSADEAHETGITEKQKRLQKKLNFNVDLKNVISVDVVSFTNSLADGVFDDAMKLSKYGSVKIGQGTYGGFLIKLKDTKLSKKEIKEDKFYAKLQKSSYYTNSKMLQQIDKLEEDVKFSEEAKKAIEDTWETYMEEYSEIN